MGTALTGTTPQDTYDSLIKVTDNGPLSGSLKVLTDGLGNNSTLSLSTAAASIAGTLAVTGNATFDTNTLFVDAAANEVGIGTITPARQLNVLGTGIDGTQVQINGTQDSAGIKLIPLTGDNYEIQSTTASKFLIYNRTDEAARLVIDGTGNVGIGTTAPATTLHVSDAAATTATFNSTFGQLAISFANSGTTFAQIGSGVSVASTGGAADLGFGTAGQANASIVFATGAGYIERVRITNNGLTFNGDTAAANALDDYEEGTFTPTIIGTSTAGTATYGGGQQGLYTKIGRMVYVIIYLGYSGGTGTGDLRISGLPFTIASADIPSFSIGTFLNVALTASNVPITSAVGNTTQVRFDQIPTGGGTQTAVAYDASAVIAVSGFYQV